MMPAMKRSASMVKLKGTTMFSSLMLHTMHARLAALLWQIDSWS